MLRECFPSSSYRLSSRFEDYGRLFVAAFSTYPFHGRFYEMSRPASRMEGHIKRTWQVIARVSMDRSPSWLSTRDCQRENSLSFSRFRSSRPFGEHLCVLPCFSAIFRFLKLWRASFDIFAVLKKLSNCRRIPRVAIVRSRRISFVSTDILLYFRLISILKRFYHCLGNNGQSGERLWSNCVSFVEDTGDRGLYQELRPMLEPRSLRLH